MSYQLLITMMAQGWPVVAADDTIKIWDPTVTADTTNTNATLSGNIGDILSVTFSLDGSKIAGGSLAGAIQIWNGNIATDSNAPIATLSGNDGPIFSVAFSPDGSRLASGDLGAFNPRYGMLLLRVTLLPPLPLFLDILIMSIPLPLVQTASRLASNS